MSDDVAVDVSALAINVTIPEALRWTDTRRGAEFLLSALNVRLLKDGHLAAKAYGRPTAGGRGTYVSFPVPDRPELAARAEPGGGQPRPSPASRALTIAWLRSLTASLANTDVR
jgi:hypothetical protein